MSIIHVPDIEGPTVQLCWKQAQNMVRCDRKKGHNGLHSWEHAASPAPAPSGCEWTSLEEDETGDYESACGRAFQSLDGDQPDFIKFCCYCGKPVVFAAPSHPSGEPT